jgi:hypothetical protein
MECAQGVVTIARATPTRRGGNPKIGQLLVDNKISIREISVKSVSFEKTNHLPLQTRPSKRAFYTYPSFQVVLT